MPWCTFYVNISWIYGVAQELQSIEFEIYNKMALHYFDKTRLPQNQSSYNLQLWYKYLT